MAVFQLDGAMVYGYMGNPLTVGLDFRASYYPHRISIACLCFGDSYLVGVVRWLNALVGGGITVIAHRRVALKGILLYVHFSLLFLFLDSCPVPGVPSFLFPMMLNNTMLFIV